eukprot:644092-Rhodomonas_salina.1
MRGKPHPAGTTRPLSAYALPTPCPILTVLSAYARYGMPGTDGAYDATRPSVLEAGLPTQRGD